MVVQCYTLVWIEGKRCFDPDTCFQLFLTVSKAKSFLTNLQIVPPASCRSRFSDYGTILLLAIGSKMTNKIAFEYSRNAAIFKKARCCCVHLSTELAMNTCRYYGYARTKWLRCWSRDHIYESRDQIFRCDVVSHFSSNRLKKTHSGIGRPSAFRSWWHIFDILFR